MFSVRVTDSAGTTAASSVTLTIAPSALTLSVPAALPSGMANVEYPLQVFTASGGTPPYLFSLGSGTLPAGLVLAPGGSLSGTPSAAGTSNFGIAVKDAAGATGTASLRLTVRALSPNLVLSAGSVSFQVATGSEVSPPSRNVVIRSPSPEAPFTWMASVPSDAPWLTLSPSTGRSPGVLTISLNSQALVLSAGQYQTTVSIACASAPCGGSPPQPVAVSLAVAPAPAQISLSASQLSFFHSGSTLPAPQNLVLSNVGSGTIGLASITSPAPWISIGAFPGFVAGGQHASVVVSVNPSLAGGAGYYQASLTVVSSGGTVSIPITLLDAPGPALTLYPAGRDLNFAVGAAPSGGTILVAATGDAPVSWTASVLPGAKWLSMDTPGGTSSAAAKGVISWRLDSAEANALSAGTYYGTIRISASEAANAPLDFLVILNVTAANSPESAMPTPDGLLFVVPAGQTAVNPVQIASGSSSASSYQAAANTLDGSSAKQKPRPAHAPLIAAMSGLRIDSRYA